MLCAICGNVSEFIALSEKLWSLLRKQKIVLLYDPVIQLLGIYPKELKTVC